MPFFRNSEIEELKREYECPPLFAGSMNNWQYTPMCKVQDFISMLSPEHEDIIKSMSETGKINENIKKPLQMTRDQLQYYLEKRIRQDQNYISDWAYLLKNKCMRYNNPSYINFNDFEEYAKYREKDLKGYYYMMNLLMQEKD